MKEPRLQRVQPFERRYVMIKLRTAATFLKYRTPNDYSHTVRALEAIRDQVHVSHRIENVRLALAILRSKKALFEYAESVERASQHYTTVTI